MLEELDVLKGRLTIDAILRFTQLAIVVVYFIIIGVMYVKNCMRKHQERLAEEELELMEA